MKRSAEAEAATLVIGYGNTLRGDDAAGPAVAELVAEQRWPGVRGQSEQQLFPELADDLSRVSRVIFVDASAVAGGGPVLTELQEAGDEVMAHRCSPGALLRMARELYGARPRAYVLALPAEQFEAGAGLSASIARHIEQALVILRDLTDPGRDRG